MDLLGGYNSDSDSDDNNAAESTSAVSRPIRSDRSIKLPPSTSSAPTKTKSKADKKKRVMGKKLLKLSSVLPEHILNQLQQGGGGDSKDKRNESDDSYDSSDDDNQGGDEKPISRKRTTTTTGPTAASSTRDYSRDEGLIGLLSELSKSNSSTSSSRKESSTKILGSEKLFATSTQADDGPSAVQQLTVPSAEKPKTRKSEPLGAAFLAATVETTIRKRKEPTLVRNIHDDNTSPSSEVPGGASVHTTSNKESSTVPRPHISNAEQKPRIQPFLRSAAPPVRSLPSTYRPHNTYVPVVSQQSTNSSYEQRRQQVDTNRNSHHQQHQPRKKKPLSRKRQMEQMLRAGKLDQVQGDHQLEGVAHVYNLDGDAAAAAASVISSSGVRVVPTGSYDPSLGATSMSTSVSSRQKNSNQLNSLLANAASLESQRAQNPHLMGQQGKRASHNASMKRKYGW